MPTTDAPREHRAGTLVVGGAILATLVVCVIASWSEGTLLVPRNGGRPSGDTLWSWIFLACLVAAFLAYTAAAVLAARGRIARRLALAIGIAIQLAPLASPLLLSTDAWTYWDYGRISVVHDGNPYAQPPSAFPDDVAYAHVGARWADTPSVYGPLFTLATAPIARIAGESPDLAAWLFKALAALAMIAATLGASRVARRPALATVVVGWSPLLAIHAAGAGHNDAWIAALAIGALVAMRARRPMLAGAAWALAGLVKWVPLLLVPLIGIAAFARLRT
ncbi:MAG: glycosyltransferase 87 family protein, partial [Kofleriaceae bacterium]